MDKILNWRKSLFDSNYHVFDNALLIFSINFIALKNSATATTSQEIYHLKSEGYSKLETKIFNNKNECLAIIRYEWLSFKAKVFLASGEELDWRFQYSWLSRFTLNNQTNKHIIYNSSSGNGLIHSNTDDELLILTGLFIKEYYTRVLIAFMLFMFALFVMRGVI